MPLGAGAEVTGFPKPRIPPVDGAPNIEVGLAGLLNRVLVAIYIKKEEMLVMSYNFKFLKLDFSAPIFTKKYTYSLTRVI